VSDKGKCDLPVSTDYPIILTNLHGIYNINKENSVFKKYLLPFAISSAAAVLTAMVILIIINILVMKIPLQGAGKNAFAKSVAVQDPSANVKADYNAITSRNLFRAKLQVEIPVPKSEKQIEEEQLTEIMKIMALKGIWFGEKKSDLYAVIDRGGQKGVWTYELGEVIEKGLVVSDIQRNSVLIKKNDFGATLKLFAKGVERANVPPSVSDAKNAKDANGDLIAKKAKEEKTPSKQQPDYSKDIRKEGNAVIMSKALADKIRADNSVVLSAVAVKASVDDKGQSNGFKIVAVDRESIAEKMGLVANDILQEANGRKLKTSDDLKNAQNAFKNTSKFEVKVLRKNQAKMLYYEVR
jgi:type II secretory pathway component PulC